MRRPPFAGAIVFASFERKRDLLKLPGGAILNAPGSSFLRLPATAQEIIDAIQEALPPSIPDLNKSVSHLREEAAAHLRERVRKVSHTMSGTLAAPLVVARGLTRLQDARGIRGRALTTPLAVLTEAWPGLNQRVTAVACEADLLLAEAASLGMVHEPILDCSCQAMANEVLAAFQSIVDERTSNVAELGAAAASRILGAGKDCLGRLEAMQTLLSRLSETVGAETPKTLLTES
jgi:hypothetical protein